MQFGAFVPQGWRFDLADIPEAEQWKTMLDVARTIERSGFDSLWVYDHFHTPPASQEPTYEAWTLMAALAATTETVRLGQMCTCNGYRLPSYLAKVAASVDSIANGRLEMGIGAEFLAYGYDFPPIGTRLGQLREAITIMRYAAQTYPRCDAAPARAARRGIRVALPLANVPVEGVGRDPLPQVR